MGTVSKGSCAIGSCSVGSITSVSLGVPQDLGAVIWWDGPDYDGTDWTDKIGGYVALGSTHNPGTTTLNGISVPDFNGSSHYLDFSASGFDIDGTFRAADHTIVAVVSDPITAFGDMILQVYNSANETSRERWGTWGDRMEHRRQSTGGISNLISTDNSDNTGYHTRAVTYTHSGTNIEFFLDGVSDGTGLDPGTLLPAGPHSQSPDLTLDAGLIGCGTVGLAPNQFWTGVIAELIVFPTVLSASQMTILENYFASRYIP